MMMIDRDFKVTYVNDSTKKLLRGNAAAFRAIWPTFDPDKILGMCIDSFHKIRRTNVSSWPIRPVCRTAPTFPSAI